MQCAINDIIDQSQRDAAQWKCILDVGIEGMLYDVAIMQHT